MLQASTIVIVLIGVVCPPATVAEQPTRTETTQALRRAVTYFREQVSTEGGYLWKYSEDLSLREGEGKATESQVWVQPPGTPAVGMAYLRVYERTGDAFYLDAAGDAVRALLRGQLAGGGWDYRIDFDPDKSKRWFYRRDAESGQLDAEGRSNTTVFDDDVSQSALRLLMCYDRATGFQDGDVRRAVRYARDAFIRAQYPNGSWPQRYSGAYDPKDYPVKCAAYPSTWSRTWEKQPYYNHYTLNDNAQATLIETFILGYEIYQSEEWIATARKGGEFLILAQMPEPQPIWAQQYNADMVPAWARKFEPPSVVSRESVNAMSSLMLLYQATGEKRFIEPIPRAIAWFERSRLPDGSYARFYELQTNRPLYFNTRYDLVETDDDLPTHYSFKSRIDPDALRARYERVLAEKPREVSGSIVNRSESRPDASAVREIIEQLDEEGRWIENGWIHCRTYINNIDLLSRYLTKDPSNG